MQQLPFQTAPAFTEEVTLDGVPFRLAFAWNTRAAHWTMHFRDLDSNSLVEGIRIVPDYELIRQFPGRGLPPGEVFFTDPRGQLKVIGRDDVPTNVEPVYVLEAEVDAL